jgi:hypothetical protein
MRLTPPAQAVSEVLSNAVYAVEPRDFLSRNDLAHPGMYAWFGDLAALDLFRDALGTEIPALLYVGQAGATKWPSGKRSRATLQSRVGGQHIRGNARSSTFRLTVSSLLLQRFDLVVVDGGKLDAAGNARVTEWISEHLRVSPAVYDDRDTLGAIEAEVVTSLDPPLNLGHCLPSAARARLTELRRSIPRSSPRQIGPDDG